MFDSLLSIRQQYYCYINIFCVTYHSKESLDDKENKVEGHDHENRELTLHQTPNQPELEQEGLPDEEEKPEDKTEVHHHLDSMQTNNKYIETYPSIAKVIQY